MTQEKWEKITSELSQTYFYDLYKEVFGHYTAQPICEYSFYEGDYTNSYRIQQIVEKVFGCKSIVKDSIDDNMNLKHIDLTIFGFNVDDTTKTVHINFNTLDKYFFDFQEEISIGRGDIVVFLFVVLALIDAYDMHIYSSEYTTNIDDDDYRFFVSNML